ncbi:soluble quino protein glucose dehydrogenase [Pseudovirgaria hyperparasitica]|uniref:Soluble quino protein glucose dehydrogenase n=1 Tax=Pseudovirgaria hyperparasitica TaxID=470096 RepID=A0A6A6W4D7_9PEZI|nr:soluble quino protein glucose dehydrogenase [Pseudovirgaria hyperparasitica]KAF2756427.1 soluble quino protein glucose dehydrogenase [Pseudovirgaria hyperparasitica]
MWSTLSFGYAFAIASLTQQAYGATCDIIHPKFPVVMSPGYESRVVVNGLKSPRHMVVDTEGNLIFSERDDVVGGIRHVKLADHLDTDVCVQGNKQLIPDPTLNHGIALSSDGKTLYVSNKDSVFSYPYDAKKVTVGTRKTLITGMTQEGTHQTRTLLLLKKHPELLLVSRGSVNNIDDGSADIASGRAQIRIFNVTEVAKHPIEYNTAEVLGYGLRNSVGVGEDPTTGNIWSVENSSDELTRDNVDMHNTNPAEELNFHGDLSRKGVEHGASFGYPLCVTAWDTTNLSSIPNIQTGQQFVRGTPNSTLTDEMCRTQHLPPRLSFTPHTAPLDIKFGILGRVAYITFHGSWNRDDPDGYRLSSVDFHHGQPRAESMSTTAEVKIMTNKDNSKCPDNCFRPTGLAWTTLGRLFMSSDATGEIFIIGFQRRRTGH